jgi:hypothetical protein
VIEARVQGERGQAVPLLLGVLVVAMVTVVAVGRLGEGAVQAARARTAADAAALAGVRGGRAAAADAAAANDGRLVRFAQVGNDVIVRVEVGGAAAEARATLRAGRVAPRVGFGATARTPRCGTPKWGGDRRCRRVK